MKTIEIKVNGKAVEARPGQTILEVVHEKGLDRIPTLCHSPELEPYGSCFLCVVEVKGRPNLVPSCATKVVGGMEIETRNDRVLASRRTALELLISNHYADCISPCKIGCPAGVDAQGYIALAAMGRYKEAVDLIRENNPFPAVCGRVCVRKCEVVCRRVDVDEPVAINAVKRYVTDVPGIYDGQPLREPSKGKSVGIVGAGPAGLTAAWFLGKQGFKPVLYEAMPKAGGMLRYGIPAYRLPNDVLDREIDYILKVGAEIRTGVRVGKDVTLGEIGARHDALFLAAGAWKGKPMRVKGEFETDGVVQGIDFLREKAENPTPVEGTVVVVGGGNTAMDVARTSWRLGAEKVFILYRRTRAEMPADRLEIKEALEEGVEIMELAAPIGVVSEKGRIKALRCIRMKLGEPDESGRRRPIPVEGSDFDFPCNMVFSAIGQSPALEGLTGMGPRKLTLTRWETIQVDPETMETNIEGVFGGGDAAGDGPSVVIDAIADGRKAARAIQAYLSGNPAEKEPFVVRKDFWGRPGKADLGDVVESPRHEIHALDVAERKEGFKEVATGFDHEDMTHECERCLSCGCVRFYDCALRTYAEEYGVDMERFAGHVRKHKVDERHPYIVYDPNKCILCTRCIRTCERILPLSAIGLVGRGFKTEMRPAMNDPLVETNCVSCGNCVDACPTGALTVKYAFPGRAPLKTSDVASRCGFCSIGCSITIKRFATDRYYISSSGVPGDYLCRYGRFGYELFVKSKRVVSPRVRRGDSGRDVDLDEAVRVAVESLKGVAEAYGPEAVGVFVSPELSNEELFLAARIAREGLGTANVASLSILARGGEGGVLDKALGFTASTGDRSVLGEADLIICNNTNLEEDHLVLAVDVLDAVKRGAKLMVVNSILSKSDKMLAALALDPMRGRASLFWEGVSKVLVRRFDPEGKKVLGFEGGKAFLERLEGAGPDEAGMAGVEEGDIEKAVDLIQGAGKVVFLHGLDRPLDRAPGDLETLSNLILLLHAKGIKADLLLPRLTANGAGLEVCGADPCFLPGRKPSGGAFPGAKTHEGLRRFLEEGKIRGALILGEDPLQHDRTGSWFRNVDFLAAMDWKETETTRSSDVVFPGSTFLEAEGTRCNFEGRVLDFTKAVDPPSGVPGWRVLKEIAGRLGVPVGGVAAREITEELQGIVLEMLGGKAPFYWNRGEKREWKGVGILVPAEAGGKAGAIPPPLTSVERYKKELREVGSERFRVH